MANVLIDVDEGLLQEIDEIVAERKKLRAAADVKKAEFKYKMSREHEHEAHRLANEKGGDMANEFLKKCFEEARNAWAQEIEIPPIRTSRVKLVNELIALGIIAFRSKIEEH